MATVTLEQFLPEVLLECPGVPNPVAINALRNACFDFCRKSLFWNETQAQVAYVAGTSEYALTPVTDAQIVSVLSLNVDEKYAIYPWPLDQVVSARPNWATAEGSVMGFVQPKPGTVVLISVPDTAGYFVPAVAYAPTRSATAVDERLYNQYLETIKYGALWKLKMMAGQPWADPSGAAYYEGHFWMGVGAATIERNRSNSRASVRVNPVPFI